VLLSSGHSLRNDRRRHPREIRKGYRFGAGALSLPVSRRNMVVIGVSFRTDF